MTLEHILIANRPPNPSYVHNTGLRFVFDYSPRRKQTVTIDNVPKPQDTFSCTFNPSGARIPVLFEVNMKGRKAIPHIRHQPEYNLVINPTKQRKCPFPYRSDIIIPEAVMGLLPVWFYLHQHVQYLRNAHGKSRTISLLCIHLHEPTSSFFSPVPPPFPIYTRPLSSHIRYALLIFLQPLYTDGITHN